MTRIDEKAGRIALTGGTLTSDFPVSPAARKVYQEALRRHMDDSADDLAIVLEVRARDAADDGVRVSLDELMVELGVTPDDFG